jgi:hypothetical protein
MATVTTALIVDVGQLSGEQIHQLEQMIDETLSQLLSGPDEVVAGWTPLRAAELRRRLLAANRPVQVQTIAAEVQADGECDRAEVYRLGGYEADRSLNGFTKPVARIMRDMADEGLLPADAAHPMQPIYDPSNPSYQRAQGFRMPVELVTVFADAFGDA